MGRPIVAASIKRTRLREVGEDDQAAGSPSLSSAATHETRDVSREYGETDHSRARSPVRAPQLGKKRPRKGK